MQTITTNTNALTQRIDNEVKRAFELCQKSANEGRQYIFFTTDRDIQRQVREKLENEHKIYVPTIISRDSPSRLAVEHYGDNTEIKLKW
jgi:cell division protein FtsX